MTIGLNSKGVATLLHRPVQEELHGPGPSWNRWKAETTATQAVTGLDQDVVLFGYCSFVLS